MGYHLKLSWIVVAALVALCLVSCDIISPSPSPTPPPTPVSTASATVLPTSTPAPTPVPRGDSTSKTVVLTLPIAGIPDDLPKYDRKEWRHWRDADSDCQDARQEVLVAESLAPVVFKTADECRVESGNWIGPYTGTAVSDPGEVGCRSHGATGQRPPFRRLGLGQAAQGGIRE